MSGIDGTITVQDVITLAAKRAGVQSLGIALGQDDISDITFEFSNMLAQWNVKTWLIWDKIDLAVTATGQATPYTIGPGGQISLTQRPDRVEQSYIRILAGGGGGGGGANPLSVDQPLNLIPAAESYADIALKGLVAFPKAWYYQPETPLGNIYWYPWPQAALYEMHVIVKNAFPIPLPLTTSLTNFAPAVRDAMVYNLARRIRQAFGKGMRPDPELIALAKDSLETLRVSQIQSPQLVMPPMLRRPSHYNVFGDITY